MTTTASFQDYRRLLTTYLAPQRGRLVLLALLLFGGAGLQLLNPQVVRGFIDATQAGQGEAASRTGLVFIGVALLQQVFRLAGGYLGETVGWQATNRLRADLTRHLLRLDMGFHKTHTPGELIERVDGDVTTLTNFFSTMILHLLWNALVILGILALLFREDWRIGVGLAVYAAAVLVGLGLLQGWGASRWQAARQARAEMSAFVEERFQGMEDIRGNGGEGYVMHRLYPLMRGVLERELPARLIGTGAEMTTRFLFVLGYAVGLGVGATLYTQGAVSLGVAFLITLYIGMLAEPLENIRYQAQDLQQVGGSLERVLGLLALTPSVQERATAVLPAGALAVAFEDVTFEYDDGVVVTEDGGRTTDDRCARQKVVGSRQQADEIPTTDYRLPTTHYALRTIAFELAPGETLGLLGRTGSGKTTLTRLLFRLYDPTEGTIRLGGQDIRAVALADLRGRVGMVTQDVQIFQASVRDNLTLFNPRLTDAEVGAALDQLGLREWVARLPQELDTRLGAGGLGLSAGEAQLLAFTRVFLKDPGLVILDEASSRLDPLTERLLERATQRLLAQRTGLVIAHRLQTVQHVDWILILDGGQVVEFGRRAELAGDRGSRFSQLLQTSLEEALA
ncbi:MAG: ABC transporter ATP-binding protein [Anaerolineae bacterium]|nr:ABC transporter ATP-binding protein [Anaerolineae bacterium]